MLYIGIVRLIVVKHLEVPFLMLIICSELLDWIKCDNSYEVV